MSVTMHFILPACFAVLALLCCTLAIAYADRKDYYPSFICGLVSALCVLMLITMVTAEMPL